MAICRPLVSASNVAIMRERARDVGQAERRRRTSCRSGASAPTASLDARIMPTAIGSILTPAWSAL